MAESRRWNWAAGLGPLVAFAGVVTYLTVFYRWPALSDVPWLNYGLLALGVALSVRGLRRAWSRGRLRRACAALGLGLSAGIAGFFVWFALVGSSDLPADAQGLALGDPLPQLVLLDQEGRPVELAALSQPLILVFYRGHW
jgi:hypothetical protein